MKKFYSCLVMLLLVCVMFFSACGGVKDLDKNNNPDKNAEALGNGGMSVLKDGYMYYVNGFLDATSYDEIDENKFGKVNKGAIYRTKLDANGNLIKDENGFLTDTEAIVKKVVGFNYGQFYIVGNYIYYTTPHNQKDSTGELREDYVDICKIRVDGNKDTNEKLYTATLVNANFDWTVYSMNGKTYVAIKEVEASSENSTTDKNSLKVIDVKTNKVVTNVKNFTSAVLLKQNILSMSNALEGGNQYVYYTRNVTEEDEFYNLGNFSGNLLCRVKIGTNSEEIFEINSDNLTYSLVDNKNNAIYYTITDSLSLTKLYKVNNTEFRVEAQKQLTDAGYSNFIIIDHSENTTLDYVVAKKDNKLYRINMVNGVANRVVINNGTGTIIKVMGNDLYYTSETTEGENTVKVLYRIDVKSSDFKAEQITSVDVTYKLEANLIDFDGRRVILFAEYENTLGNEDDADNITSYYLNVIDTLSKEDGNYVSRFMGEFIGDDKPQQPKDDKETEDIDESKPWVK